MLNPHFLVHNANGLQLWCLGLDDKSVQCKPIVGNDAAESVSVCFLSDDGHFLAVALKQSVLIYRQETSEYTFDKVAFRFPLVEAKAVNFSPKSNFISIFGTATTSDDKNLKVFDLSTGNLVFETSSKKRDLINWANDESLAYRIVGSELYLYEKNDFSKPTKKISQKIESYSLAYNNSSGCNYIAIFVKGKKGAPSAVKVCSYPYVDNFIVSQSLFKADSVEIKWNSKGDAMLLVSVKDVDTTGKSYYGETALHFLDLKGNACLVSGKKEGSVHACEWLPNNEGFLAVYGRPPAAISLFNNKGEIAFHFGEAPVNSIFINPFCNLVAFAGFGNLPGDVLVWNLKSRTKVSHFKASDTTHFSWTADGQHILTSTLYSRLKVGNGFKVWDYLGNLLHVEDCRDEQCTPLFKLTPVTCDAFQMPEIVANTKGKILTEVPVQKYIPPCLRNQKQMQAAKRQQTKNNSSSLLQKEKKLRNLKQKLEQIEALKKSLNEGKQLEKNQMDKIEKEGEIINEISALKLEG